MNVPEDQTGQQSPVVETGSGWVSGLTVQGIAAFKGVPYAADTSGENRFRPPQPRPSWQGVRAAVDYAGQAPQTGHRPQFRPELADFSGRGDASPETEDCLTLNIWSPQLDPEARRPVMVWFHGGAFSFGSANVDRTEGSRLARRGDVVVVTVNHRLNVFGFLDLSSFADPAFSASGNAGVLDLVAALEWVRANIAQFGGDPENVTIFGESGGGGKVSTLLAMPSARGLFHRAVIQSGASVRVREPDRAHALTELVLHELGTDEPGRLQTLPVAELLAAAASAQRALAPSPWPLLDRYPFGPVLDGELVPQHPFHPGAPDIAADIPLLIGDVKDESTFFLTTDDRVWERTLTEDELGEQLRELVGSHADQVAAVYAELHPEASPTDRLIAVLTDAQFRIRSLYAAARKAVQRQAPVYMYSFQHETPVLGGRLKSPHSFDVPFTFDTLDLTNATEQSSADLQLAAQMSGAWATFARTGVPAAPGLPIWPSYDLTDRATMILDVLNRVEHDPGRRSRELWESIIAG